MSIKKIMLAAMAILVCTGAYAKPKVRLAPGAKCYVWNENTTVKPQTPAVGAFVDNADFFDGLNIKECNETKNIDDYFFVMWEGYLQVPQSGNYIFNLQGISCRFFCLKFAYIKKISYICTVKLI